MNARTTRIEIKIVSYFGSALPPQFAEGMTVEVTAKDGWNGQPKGSKGVLQWKRLTRVFGRPVDVKVLAVRWEDGTGVDWGMHMTEKLKVVR